MLRKALRAIAFRYGKLRGPYLRFCRPNGEEYADFLKRWGPLRHVGDHCCILTSARITDPASVSIGNNVILSACTLVGHDGAVAMLNRAYGKQLDAVGKIVIHDNVFVGQGALILRNVTIGPNAIVAAGAVVNRDVGPDEIVGGVPAKRIGSVRELVDRLDAETAALPWADLLRGGADQATLHAKRMAYFFPDPPGAAEPAPAAVTPVASQA